MIDLKHISLDYRRETKAPFTYFKDGAVVTDDIRVIYRARSVKEARATAEKPGGVAEMLAATLLELPDLNSDGNPIEITVDFLVSLDATNLWAMQKAINDDIFPK